MQGMKKNYKKLEIKRKNPLARELLVEKREQFHEKQATPKKIKEKSRRKLKKDLDRLVKDL